MSALGLLGVAVGAVVGDTDRDAGGFGEDRASPFLLYRSDRGRSARRRAAPWPSPRRPPATTSRSPPRGRSRAAPGARSHGRPPPAATPESAGAPNWSGRFRSRSARSTAYPCTARGRSRRSRRDPARTGCGSPTDGPPLGQQRFEALPQPIGHAPAVVAIDETHHPLLWSLIRRPADQGFDARHITPSDIRPKPATPGLQ